ncbi:hypothetical protein V6N12_035759 [Hibiscus sabdariffa]|uniref:Phosphatidate cytidylyltransferase n=1 Tax=Hibiscus sabdariffa TaxID=183260 RepID=A0ABR2EQE7_9ROSI
MYRKMETKDAAAHAHLLHFLKATPPVDFCCVYGSALHSINPDKGSKLRIPFKKKMKGKLRFSRLLRVHRHPKML